MKNLFLFLLLILFMSINLFSEKNKINDKEIDMIKINFISFDVTTVVDVGCEDRRPLRDLVSMYEGVILNKKIIKDKSIINKLISGINSTAFNDNVESPNIRIKIEFYHNKKRKHYMCIGKYHMFFDSKTLVFSKEINDYVLKIIDYYKYYPKKSSWNN